MTPYRFLCYIMLVIGCVWMLVVVVPQGNHLVSIGELPPICLVSWGLVDGLRLGRFCEKRKRP